MSRFEPAVQRIVAAHHGVVSRKELLSLGLSSSAIARRLVSGELHAVVPGVYRPAAIRPCPEITLRAVALRVGPDGVIAGRWAAWWHGLSRATVGPVSIIVPPGRWPSTVTGLTVSRRVLDRADRTTIRGLALTGRARTVLDCAGWIDAEDIRDAALQRGTSIWSLERALERYGPGRGVVVARRLVDEARGGGVSRPERVLVQSLRSRGRERWTAGHWIRLAAAEEYWLDLAIEELRLAVEVDGWTVHSRADKYDTDRERQNALVGAGWTVLRYTPRRLREDLDGTVTEILDLAAALRRNRLPAEPDSPGG